jgi:hypothetical protein
VNGRAEGPRCVVTIGPRSNGGPGSAKLGCRDFFQETALAIAGLVSDRAVMR